MKGPPVPGKRREKLQLDLSLLMTEDGVEFCSAEARARSLGLLGKKWPPLLLPSQAQVPAQPQTKTKTQAKLQPQPPPQIPVNFNDDGRKTNATRRLQGEPTVTINTKEALADVFGMFNSPEKTMRSSQAPGSKHAPVKKIEPITPSMRSMIPAPTPRTQLQNENALSLKDVTTPTPAQRDPSLKTPSSILKPKTLKSGAEPFKVFTPKMIRESLPEEEEEEEPRGVFSPVQASQPPPSFRPPPKSENIAPVALPTFGVFSRPPPRGENLFVPKRESQSQAPPPLRGRFGPLNVMTPITERTYEFTTSSRTHGTPNEDSPFLRPEREVLLTAERLAAELKEEEEREEALSLARESFNVQKSEHASRVGDEVYTADRATRSTLHVRDDDTEEEDAEYISSAMATIEEKTNTLCLATALATKMSFKPSNPCNPFDPPIISTLLSIIPTDSSYHDFRDREARLLDNLRKSTQKRRKLSGNSTANLTLDVAQASVVTFGERRLEVTDKLGEGGFGTVFAARERKGGGSRYDSDEDDDYDEDTSSFIALKVVKPRNIWEYHVLQRLRTALPARLRRSVVTPHALYAFRDESFLILDLCSQGTLLDIVNRATDAGVSQQGACLDEMLVIFFTVELLRLLEGMHSVGFIHGDLKIDNCLLRLEDVPGGTAAWNSVYQPSGEGGWSSKGIKLIDFGRTIDTGLFPKGQMFIADWNVDARDCPEMRENQRWTFQPDYFGLAGIIYCMLFGKYIEASSVTMTEGRSKLSIAFKRYWQGEMWTRLFDVLLNPCLVRPNAELPLCEELCQLREEMEGWLECNSNRTGNTLKALLKKIERAVI
jgi:checkpoint serine/threonine-protein kinase